MLCKSINCALRGGGLGFQGARMDRPAAFVGCEAAAQKTTDDEVHRSPVGGTVNLKSRLSVMASGLCEIPVFPCYWRCREARTCADARL